MSKIIDHINSINWILEIDLLLTTCFKNDFEFSWYLSVSNSLNPNGLVLSLNIWVNVKSLVCLNFITQVNKFCKLRSIVFKSLFTCLIFIVSSIAFLIVYFYFFVFTLIITNCFIWKFKLRINFLLDHLKMICFSLFLNDVFLNLISWERFLSANPNWYLYVFLNFSYSFTSNNNFLKFWDWIIYF